MIPGTRPSPGPGSSSRTPAVRRATGPASRGEAVHGILRTMIDARHRWVFPDPLRLDPEFRAAARAEGVGTFAATVMARRGIADPQRARRVPRSGHRRAQRSAPAARCRRAARADRPRPRGRRARDGLRGLRRGRPHRPRPAGDRVPPPGDRDDAVRPVAARRGPRPVARGRGRRRGGRDHAHRDGGHGLHERRRDRRGRRPGDRRHRHGPPPPAAGAAGGRRDRQPAPRGLRVPGPGAQRLGRGVHGGAPAPRASSRPPRRTRWTWRSWRPSARWRTSRRSSARTGRSPGSAWSGCARRRAPGSPRCWSAPASPRRRWTSRPSASCSPRASTPRAGWGRRSTPPACCSPRRRRRPPASPRPSRPRTSTRRDMMRSAIAEARIGARPAGPGRRPRPGGARARDRGGRRPGHRRRRRRRPGRCSLHGPWPVGIIGLVAGRLADETGRPAVIGTPIGDVIRASCRSDGRLNLAEILAACGDLFVRFGGHAAAAGFELPADRWPEFTERFLALVAAGGTGRPADAARGGPRPAGGLRRLRAVPRPRPARPVRSREPGAARGRPRAHRAARPGRQRRPHPARPAP